MLVFQEGTSDGGSSILQFDPRDGGFPLFVAWETVPSADGNTPMVNVETVCFEPSNDVGHDQIDRFKGSVCY